MKTRQFPAVVLGGSAAGLAVIRALASAGVPVIAASNWRDEFGLASRHALRALRCPHPEDAEAEYVAWLLELGREHPGALLVPASDATVTAVARHKRELEESYVVACMGEEVARLFLDKWETAKLAERLGVPAPLTFIPECYADLQRRRDQLAFPCVVKPRDGHLFYRVFGRKMDRVESYDELVTAWAAADDAGLRVMVQEFVPGPDSHGVNYNAYVHDGRVLAACTAQRLRSAPPQVGSPRVVVSCVVPEVAEPAARLLAGMGYEGFANVEFKKDVRDGVYKLMEVNGRHNMSSQLSVRCGVNFPLIQYEHLVNGRLSTPDGFETGVHWIAFPADLSYGLRHRREERFGPREQLRPYRRAHVFDVWSLDDPAPAVRTITMRLRKIPARVAAMLARARLRRRPRLKPIV